MASYNELIALIDAYINRNGVQAITGQVLNGVLKAMVEQIGRGYAIMGTALPADNPGTPDAPESWFASTPGTYTNFGGLEVADAEFALLSYTPASQMWEKTTLTQGITGTSASVDSQVGTPSVSTSYEDGVLSFEFHNLKGETGDAAGFGSVSASVDGNIGTPGVSVSTSGPDTAKNMVFAFRNLKGETGVTSVVATVDNTIGNPSCAVSLQGQELHLDFHGLKGAQGDTGSSIDYPFTIVNNLTTNDPAQALSAAMGVQLEGELGQLEAELNQLDLEVTGFDSVTEGSVSGWKNYFYFVAKSGVKYSFSLVCDPASSTKYVGLGNVANDTNILSRQIAEGGTSITFDYTPNGDTAVYMNSYGVMTNVTATVIKDGNNLYSLNERVTSLENDVEDIQDDLVRISEEQMTPSETHTGYYLKYDGIEGAHSSYDVFLFSVVDTASVHLVVSGGANAPNSISLWGFYNSNTISTSSRIQIGEGSTGSYDGEIQVPSGATYMGVSSLRSTQQTSVKKIIQEDRLDYIQNEIDAIDARIDDITELIPPVSVAFENGEVAISKMQNGKKAVYTFKQFGVNNLWQLYAVAFYDGNTELSKITTGTDSVGPYQVAAVNNADGDGQELTRFTGGCHGYNGDQTGTATASTYDMKVYCDGKETNTNADCNEATIVVTNRIQGWNTKKADGTGREIIQERVTYKLGDDGNINITNEISALEDVTFSLYYGLQIAFARDYIKFISESKSVWKPKADNASYSGDSLDAVETKNNGRLHQRMFVNPFGLGHFGYVPNNLPKAFQSDKAYYNLIRENVSVSANEELVWSGGYRFDFDGNVVMSGSQDVSAGTGINISFFLDVTALRGKTITLTMSWPSGTISGSTLALYQTTSKDSSGIISSVESVYSDTPKQISVMNNASWFWIYAGSVNVSQDITIKYLMIE